MTGPLRATRLALAVGLGACGGCGAAEVEGRSEVHHVSGAWTSDGADPEVAGDVAGGERAGEDAPLDVVETFEGRASYYADSLAGNPTASGAPYEPSERTAASRHLPFGTRVRVTRLDTGATVEVVVNDRGPFGDARRVIDLSRAAAEDLDMIRAGVVEVRVDVLR